MEIFALTRDTKRLNLLTTSVSVLVAFLLLMTHQYLSGHKQMQEELQTQAAIVGANSVAALVFDDGKAARESLGTILLNPRILGGAFYLADGSLFIVANDTDRIFPDRIDPRAQNTPPVGKTELQRFTGLLRTEISQDGNRIGSLVLHVSHRQLYLNLLEYAVGLAAIGLVALLLARRFTAGLRNKMALTEGQLEQMALYDRITGLPNRRFFEHELKKAMIRIKREKENAALFLIDVDDFKKVNDLCGHHAGDEVLGMIADRLKKSVRDDDIIARIGGDEFAAILFKVGDPRNVERVAQKMIQAMTEPFPTQPIPSHVGLSIGVTMMPNDSEDPATLIRWSDMAMYAAKAQGKNRAQFFSEEINRKIRNDLQIEAGLRQAIKDPGSGLYVAYQPQVCATTREIVGVEALIRWRQDDGKSVSPGEFIPVAEKTGLIIEIGAWLVGRICRDLAHMRQSGIELPKIAINVSPKEMTRGTAIVGNACLTLTGFGESVERFQFEITENALIDENASDVLKAFHDAGFTLAIDDFGTGYSSLGYLKRFRVSTLKIDQQFVQSLPGDNEDATIVSAVIQMAQALGITVVAEGVETEAQAAFLTEHGCDILQGYHVGRPMPVHELVTFIHGQHTT
ncbi:diguanylate cyclase (GGDEF) domain-containing protein [Formivibrio citricus]|uniref:Diguanylate cyclase (GGDEF) domain-containing protein n=1 Tax=Formivibrio citricus TaxID=83765 RepID=A0A1I5AQY8_9NEIS|nr:EAL domain-containing protein [Formivibrio citricus]SFN64792.1 diguanylate cyclase (GGDEF) domain-containing protein [Formivibrio citricus]